MVLIGVPLLVRRETTVCVTDVWHAHLVGPNVDAFRAEGSGWLGAGGVFSLRLAVVVLADNACRVADL
jgi:hypothetical protein